MIQRAWRWLHDRAGLGPLWEKLGKHPVPPGTTRGPAGWMYVFGFATLAVFILQVATGAALTTKYIPSPAHAYQSIRFIEEDVLFGRIIRGMHFFGASAMVLMMLIHAARVFLTGSYKYPRELTWITGVLLFVLVIAMAYTGQLLRWNQDGLWGVVVASQYAGRVPVVGGILHDFVLAGETVGGATLSRFFALHVVWMPLMIIGLVAVHMYLVILHGISEPPVAGQPVDRETYRDRYRRLVESRGKPYWPDAAKQEISFSIAVLLAIAGLAWAFGARELGLPPDPVVVPAESRPDWFLMWYYSLLAVKPRGLENLVMVYMPLVAVAAMLALPLLRGTGERSPGRRPLAVLVVAVATVGFVTLTGIGYRGDWVPDFGTQPLDPSRFGEHPEPAFLGVTTFHRKGCQYCHEVGGRGGSYGPSLDDVLRRMSEGAVTSIILAGAGDMPAYRDAMSEEELRQILAFLRVLARQEER